MFIKSLYRYISNREARFDYNNAMGFYKHLPDEQFLKKAFRAHLGYDLNLSNPKTYNEKIQWLKLNDRREEYTKLVDKLLVKEYVANTIGSQYVIPTIGQFNSFDEIDFSKMPSQFVLKCTHDSGGIIICKDKDSFDISKAKKVLSRHLKRDYYLLNREWPYKNVERKIIAEKYMEDTETGELRDYKFFTFNGKVKALFIATDRQNKKTETKFDFFDENFNHLSLTNGHPNSNKKIDRPKNFELMKSLAERLSIEIPHVRIDFYEIDGSVFFGEMTFFHWSGLVPFDPQRWDEVFGSWIILPQK